MAIPTSGEVRAKTINEELGRSATAELRIDRAENGGYATINQASPARPNSSNPASYSEWRGYNHNAGGTPTYVPLELGYDEFSFDQACRNFSNGFAGDLWGIDPFDASNWFEDSEQLFVQSRGGFQFAPPGFYSRDDVYRQWGGSSWIGSDLFCRT